MIYLLNHRFPLAGEEGSIALAEQERICEICAKPYLPLRKQNWEKIRE
jgi:hypothetical protein